MLHLKPVWQRVDDHTLDVLAVTLLTIEMQHVALHIGNLKAGGTHLVDVDLYDGIAVFLLKVHPVHTREQALEHLLLHIFTNLRQNLFSFHSFSSLLNIK